MRRCEFIGHAMRRRTFLGTIGGAAVWPLVARAQTPSMPVVGFLGNWPAGLELTIDGFRRGLKEMGFVEGQNVVIYYRWAEGALSITRSLRPIWSAGASP